jgi:rhamnosyltransferase subunit B
MTKKTSKRILLATFGSLGDVYPYIAIARELRIRGHRAVIATSEIYRYIIESEAIEFRAIRPDGLINVTEEGEFIQLLRDSQQALDYGISYLIAPHLRATYNDLLEVVREADLLLTHHLALAASLAAEKTGTPRVSTALSPVSFMSAYDFPNPSPPPTSPYERALTLVANDASRRYFRWQARFWSAPVRQLRAELGLPPKGDSLFEGQHSSELVLALFSKVLAAPQPDWPTQTRVTGFPFYDQHKGKSLSPESVKFLQAGPPPIVFTLGSLMVWTPGNFYLEGAIAAQKLGYRAVLLMGQAAHHIPSHQLPEGAIAVDYAPHSTIFPRAAAIVHHGGIGTTGQALRAGRPMLVVPYAYDQPDNAARLIRLGVARTIERHHCTAARIATELKHLLFDPSYVARAAEVGRLVQAEEGVWAACNAIETYLDHEGEIIKQTWGSGLAST